MNQNELQNTVLCGDALEVLKTLPDECVQMCVTSPPYDVYKRQVKEQFDKPDGIQAYHGYLSFKETDLTPELAQHIGMEFANSVWGKRHQVLVTCARNMNTPLPMATWTLPWCSTIRSVRAWAA